MTTFLVLPFGIEGLCVDDLGEAVTATNPPFRFVQFRAGRTSRALPRVGWQRAAADGSWEEFPRRAFPFL